jgi:hypothetical protein
LNSGSDSDSLYFVERDLVLGPIVQLRRARRLVRSDLLRVFKIRDRALNVLRQPSRAGRLVVAPVRSSLKVFWHPAFFNAASCKAGFWSSLETRA